MISSQDLVTPEQVVDFRLMAEEVAGIARDHAGVFGPMLVRAGVDARDAMGGMGSTRVLVVHGTADEIVPVHHADRIVEAAERA
ncbi:MAG: hypothetical protein AAGF32_06785, partial [Pseudomonadota bacterium]